MSDAAVTTYAEPSKGAGRKRLLIAIGTVAVLAIAGCAFLAFFAFVQQRNRIESLRHDSAQVGSANAALKSDLVSAQQRIQALDGDQTRIKRALAENASQLKRTRAALAKANVQMLTAKHAAVGQYIHGYSQGKQESQGLYADGHTAGYATGKTDGYNQGYKEGYDLGLCTDPSDGSYVC